MAPDLSESPAMYQVTVDRLTQRETYASISDIAATNSASESKIRAGATLHALNPGIRYRRSRINSERDTRGFPASAIKAGQKCTRLIPQDHQSSPAFWKAKEIADVRSAVLRGARGGQLSFRLRKGIRCRRSSGPYDAEGWISMSLSCKFAYTNSIGNG